MDIPSSIPPPLPLPPAPIRQTVSRPRHPCSLVSRPKTPDAMAQDAPTTARRRLVIVRPWRDLLQVPETTRVSPRHGVCCDCRYGHHIHRGIEKRQRESVGGGRRGGLRHLPGARRSDRIGTDEGAAHRRVSGLRLGRRLDLLLRSRNAGVHGPDTPTRCPRLGTGARSTDHHAPTPGPILRHRTLATAAAQLAGGRVPAARAGEVMVIVIVELVNGAQVL
jgi:hypothetical protein